MPTDRKDFDVAVRGSTSDNPTATAPDPGLVKLVEALARAQARRDNRADVAARKNPQDRTHNGR